MLESIDRWFNLVSGIAVVVLAARSLYRSRKSLRPSERLILLGVGGYAFAHSAFSLDATLVGLPWQVPELAFTIVNTWLVVGLLLSKPRTPSGVLPEGHPQR